MLILNDFSPEECATPIVPRSVGDLGTILNESDMMEIV
jgi:hypothetical protein